MKVRITDIHEADAYYLESEDSVYVGDEVYVRGKIFASGAEDGYSAFEFTKVENKLDGFFFAVKYEEI